MPILTTTIGAYPKPDYVPVPNWFDMGQRDFPVNAPHAHPIAQADLRADSH
jgi:hypothetical protein